MRDNVNIKLSDATAAELAQRPIEYDTGFTLLPGKYSIKFLARDDETGRIGTYQTRFIIPNLNKETTRVPISSVVLSSQRVDTKRCPLQRDEGQDSRPKKTPVNPLVQEGLKLIPSVTRVFDSGREMYVYLQAYDGGSAATAGASAPAKPASPLIAYVSLYQQGKKAFESAPVAATPEADSRLGVTPLSFQIGLGTSRPANISAKLPFSIPPGIGSRSG